MKEGMLWFDNDPKTTLAAKVQRAVAYYTEKYGHMPDLCLVHPNAIEPAGEAPPVTIRPYRAILSGHLWIGCDSPTESRKEKEVAKPI